MPIRPFPWAKTSSFQPQQGSSERGEALSLKNNRGEAFKNSTVELRWDGWNWMGRIIPSI
jgi:hypothetical protein